MFSFSRQRIITNCNVKNLFNDFNKCVFSRANHKIVLSKKNNFKEDKFVTLNYRKIDVAHYDRKHFVRYYSSNIVKDDFAEKSAADNEASEVSSDFYHVDEEAITNRDPDLLKKLKLCMLEVETFKQEGYEIPSSMKTEEWKDLLSRQTRSAKLKYLRFLFINECRKKNEKVKKEKKRLERVEKFTKLMENGDPNHLRYGLGGNTIFIRIQEGAMNMTSNNRLVVAMKFGQNLVIDCSFQSYMSDMEQKLCAKQLMYTFATNRNHIDPFNIHFTGINRESVLIQRLHKYIPTMYDCDFPMNVSEKSYLELFPRERLVYLTPHCRNDLKSFNHNDIYIIGAIVDKSNSDPLTLAKAKSEGLRMAKFPLDQYLTWSLGTKSLTIDQCINILLEMKTSGDWEKAFQYVPKRKVLRPDDSFNHCKDEEGEDNSMNFGQSFITSHEWGRNKTHGQSRKRDYDLRRIVASYKKWNKTSN